MHFMFSVIRMRSRTFSDMKLKIGSKEGHTPVAHSEELRLGSQGTRVRIPLTAGKVDSEPSNLTLADLAAAVIPATGRSSRLLYSLPQEGVAGHSKARCQNYIRRHLVVQI